MRQITRSFSFLHILWCNSGCCAGLMAQSARPNILILTADDLGWNDISLPEATKGNSSLNHQTPHIDRLLRRGMIFTSAYTQQNSAPTRAALLTGLYANRTHVYNVGALDRYAVRPKSNDAWSTLNKTGITREEARIIPPQQEEVIADTLPTLFEVLHGRGYETYHFGKVHGFDLKKTKGVAHPFPASKVVRRTGKSPVNYFACDDDGEWYFDTEHYSRFAAPYTEAYIRKELLPVANGNDPFTLVGTPKHFTDAMADVVAEQLHRHDGKAPFCMWVCFHAIHSDIVARPDLQAKYRLRGDLDPRHPHPDYAALTEQLDQSVGRILAALDDPNGDGDTSDSMTENTIVIFSGDNGGVDYLLPHSCAPLRMTKGTLYEGGIRVPMGITWPRHIQAGSSSDEPVHVIDYLPSLAEVAGLPAGELFTDGESMLPLWLGREQRMRRTSLYWHFPGYMDGRGVPASVINKRIGDKRYKYRYNYQTLAEELYCLDDDIGETRNLLAPSAPSSSAAIAEACRADLAAWLERTSPRKMYDKESRQEIRFPLRPQTHRFERNSTPIAPLAQNTTSPFPLNHSL